MAFDIGAITGKLILATDKWDNAIQKTKSDLKSFEGAILRSEQRLKGLGVRMGLVGGAITAVNFKLVKMAADVQESENLFEVSMGNMANRARAWSTTVSKALGLNQFEIRKTVGTFNVMLKSMGLTTDQAFEMSKSLTLLSADMASFFNLRPEEAFQKLQSGISGEVEPLKRLGIIVNETTVKQFALNKGIIQQGQNLSEAQKILARYGVILEATKVAQGDLGRTMDSITNRTRILTSQTTELAVKLGNSLLPSVNKLLGLLLNGVKTLNDFSDRFPHVTSNIAIFGATLGIALTTVGAVLLALPGLASAAAATGTTIAASFGAVTLTSLKLAGAIGAVVLALQNLDAIKFSAQSLASGLDESLGKAANKAADFVDKLANLPLIGDSFKNQRDSLRRQANAFFERSEETKQKASDTLDEMARKQDEYTVKVTTDLDLVGDKYDQLWQGAVEAARKATEEMTKKQKTWFDSLQKDFKLGEEVGTRTFNVISDSFSTLIFDTLKGEARSFEDFFENFGNSILKIIADIIAQMIAMKIIGSILGLFSGGPAPLPSGFNITGNAGSFAQAPFAASIPQFREGSDGIVPFTQIAKIHAGEEIIPAGGKQDDNMVIEITNVITNEAVAAAMNSTEGRRVVTNIINKDSLRGGTIRKAVLRR